MATGYVYHEVFGWHDTGTSGGIFPSNPAIGVQPYIHFENAETKRRMHELIVVSGLIDQLTRIAPIPATETDILRFHTKEHIERIKAESQLPKGGDAGDGFSPFGAGSYEIALLAAGGMIEAVKAVWSGEVDNAYALIRPPGHHAVSENGMGFCIFSNLAIAAKYAQDVLGVKQIAIVDWDVHHGNGTQAAFYDDPSVLTISVHQDNVFPPDSGTMAETGEGAGVGYSINVPLPPGTGDGGYAYVLGQVVTPAIRNFKPDLILVASGFDASGMDPLARQMVSSEGFRNMARTIRSLADDVCGGKLAMSHEGGYSAVYVPFCGLAVMEELVGATPFGDPMFPVVSGWAGHELKDSERAVIDMAAALARDIVAA
jgi:acetoin utilization deacetylase AcuC-like enzyme